MKLAICLLLACLLTASQQQPQFMRQPRWPGYSYWQSPFYPGWSYNYHQAPFLSDHNRFFEVLTFVTRIQMFHQYRDVFQQDKATPSGFFEAKEQDIEARVKGGYKGEKLNENSDTKPETRLLNSFGFVSNPYNYNPFLKTLYQFTSATATVCSVTTCIPAAQFADAAAQASICAGRRRREDRAVLEWFDAAGETSINSSPVERYELNERFRFVT